MDNNKKAMFNWTVIFTVLLTTITLLGLGLWMVLGKTDTLWPLPLVWGGIGWRLRLNKMWLCASVEEEVAERARMDRLLRELREERARLREERERLE